MMKNPAAALFLLLLGLALAYSVLISLPPAPAGAAAPFDRGPEACASGSTRGCAVGSCGGTETCVDGLWSGCRWGSICSPGARVPCFDGACISAVKECNSCGTGYSQCFNP